jgi:hypothetical protein
VRLALSPDDRGRCPAVADGLDADRNCTWIIRSHEKGKRYPITMEALKTRWQRDRAKAALVLPSVANQVA